MAPRTNVVVDIAGEILGGNPLQPSDEKITLPAHVIEPDELVYRVVFAWEHAQPGQYVIAELRDHASTGELVIASFEGNIYVGRWWAKHGKRELLVKDDPNYEPLRGATILAVINQIVAL